MHIGHEQREVITVPKTEPIFAPDFVPAAEPARSTPVEVPEKEPILLP